MIDNFILKSIWEDGLFYCDFCNNRSVMHKIVYHIKDEINQSYQWYCSSCLKEKFGVFIIKENFPRVDIEKMTWRIIRDGLDTKLSFFLETSEDPFLSLFLKVLKSNE